MQCVPCTASGEAANAIVSGAFRVFGLVGISPALAGNWTGITNGTGLCSICATRMATSLEFEANMTTAKRTAGERLTNFS